MPRLAVACTVQCGVRRVVAHRCHDNKWIAHFPGRICDVWLRRGSLCDLVHLPLYTVILGRCNQSLSKLEEIGNFKMWVVARRSPNTDLAGMLTDATGAVNVQNHILQKKRRNTGHHRDLKVETLTLHFCESCGWQASKRRSWHSILRQPMLLGWEQQELGLQTWIFQCNQHNNTCLPASRK